MGCVNSKVDKEETVRRCRERKRLMMQLITCRADLAAANLAYLRSLKNTGATLRQLTEVESLMIPGNGSGSPPVGLQLPPSPPPPPPLPPSPPPPPPPPPPQFNPKVTKPEIEEEDEGLSKNVVEDAIEIDDFDNESCSLPPFPPQGSAWEFWDPFGPPSSSNSSSKDEAAVEEEDWAEANAEFREEEEEDEHEEEDGQNVARAESVVSGLIKDKTLGKELLLDDNSSAVSLLTKETDMALVVWRTKKSLAGIVKEIDDYFLMAAAGGNEVLVLLESDRSRRLHWMEQVKGKSSKSTKVFSALSWNWCLRSPQSSNDACDQEERDVNRSSNHCSTLEKLYAKEQRLYKEVKEEELVKVLLRKKTLLLQKLEARDSDYTRTVEIRTDIENLHSQILSLQESISATCLSISKLRDEELHPQLIELTFGLMRMWRTMYECHQVQNHIAQQSNLRDRHPGLEPTSDSHHLATAQLETEVTFWYNSFCNLLKSQRDYVQILNQWVRLTDCLPDMSEVTGSTYRIHSLCEEWQLSLDRLPDKVAAEAIKSFLSVIHSIFLQQKEECVLQKKSHRLESKLEKELTSFSDLDKHEENSVGHPALATKLEALKKRVEEEKAKYLSSVRNSRAMTLNNLQTSLPNVFQALMGFAGVCVQAFEGIWQHTQATAADHLGSISPLH